MTEPAFLTVNQDQSYAYWARLERENAELRRENECIKKEAARLQAQRDDLAARHATLRAAHEAALEQVREKEKNLGAGYELFKSFVDRGDRAIILVDAAYTIRYVNRPAAAALQLPDPYILLGRQIFDFFAHKDAMKVKEKIDQTFLSGEKQTIKGVTFQNLKSAFFKLKIKTTRVRYQDKPSIKLVLN